MQNKFLSKDDLHLVHPKFRDNIMDAWLRGEEVPIEVTLLSGEDLTKAQIERGQELNQKYNWENKAPLEDFIAATGKRVKISIEGENTSIGFTVEKSPENDNDWADILEGVARSFRAPVVEDKELI